MIGEPDAGNPHVRFDEGRQETCVSRGAPVSYSTRGGSPCPRLSTQRPERDQRSDLMPLLIQGQRRVPS
jgi:hypothetical protein